MPKKKLTDPIFTRAATAVADHSSVQMDRSAASMIYAAGIVVAAIDRLTSAVERNTRVVSAAASSRGEL